MESYLNENFGDVKPKNSSDEALQRWRKLCWIVKNPKRRFRFTANLSKRSEAEAIRRSNQVRLFRPSLVTTESIFLFLLVDLLIQTLSKFFGWFIHYQPTSSSCFDLGWDLSELVLLILL